MPTFLAARNAQTQLGVSGPIRSATAVSRFKNYSNGDQVGTSGSPINPLLGALRANGGPTRP